MDSIETAKIAAIVRYIMEQMNLSKPDKDPEDSINNVGEFHYEPSVGEIFTTWYARNRHVYENWMAELPNVSTGDPAVCLRVCTQRLKQMSIITPRHRRRDMIDV
ncbi:hypothetical protein ACTXT7_009115 [Hymenolepis weldensis]